MSMYMYTSIWESGFVFFNRKDCEKCPRNIICVTTGQTLQFVGHTYMHVSSSDIKTLDDTFTIASFALTKCVHGVCSAATNVFRVEFRARRRGCCWRNVAKGSEVVC